jgi:hypothetical protein
MNTHDHSHCAGTPIGGIPVSGTAADGRTGRRVTAALIALVLAAAVFALAACGSAASAAGAGPRNTSASALANDSDLVDHTLGLVVPGAVHVAAGADLQQARTVVRTS